VILDQCDRVGAIEWLFAGPYGRLRDVVEGPDGYLYFTTSNRDGRANPGINDDRILRIVPRRPE
jgi:glucose/arabinose dehydrogenase